MPLRSESEAVQLWFDDDVARVRLNRPEKHNGLTLAMIAQLGSIAGELAKNRDIRAVVLDGAGDSFCSGLDIAAATGDTRKAGLALIPRRTSGANTFQNSAWAWRSVPVPVIALLHGHCYGGGLQIALGADFRFSLPTTEFSILETRWGLIPDMSASASLPQLTGIDIAKKLTMTGEFFSGTEAAQYGLVTEVTDDLEGAAEALITKLRDRSPDAVAAAKALYETNWAHSPRASLPVELFWQARMLATRNHRKAVKAGMRKVRPEFGPRQV